ncbi:hypothetical protein V2I01_35225 [Micromonospora sp. BRA006-A]|nr:hypothetical protein [Micromonospora sp. BRA006-A]
MPTYFSPASTSRRCPAGRPIGPVGMSTAAFVGVAPDRGAHVGEALAVNSWTEFLRLYADGEQLESTPLARAVFGFLDNGGTRCWVVNVGEGGRLTGTGGRRGGLELLEAIDEISIVAAPGYHDPVSHEALISMAERLRTMVAICDPPPEVTDVSRLTRVATPGKPPKPAAAGSADKPAGGTPGGADDEPPGTGGDRPRQSDYATFTSRGSGSATRSAATSCSPRRAGTSPASGPAPTRCAACTRRRPTSRYAGPSTSRTG